MNTQAYWILKNGEVLLSRNGVGEHGHIVLWNYEKFNFLESEVKEFWESLLELIEWCLCL